MLGGMGTQVFFYQDDGRVQTINIGMAQNEKCKTTETILSNQQLYLHFYQLKHFVIIIPGSE